MNVRSPGEVTRLFADLIAPDEALEDLATVDHRKVRIVEMRFFTDLTVSETAELLALSPATIKREWEFARTWLYREIGTKGRHE